MNITKYTFIREAEVNTDENKIAYPIEISVLAGKVGLTSKLSEDSLAKLLEIYDGVGVVNPTLEEFRFEISNYKFKMLVFEPPQPSKEDRAFLVPLVLENGGSVYACFRQVVYETVSGLDN